MYNPFEETLETTKTGKEFKRVIDLLESLNGKISFTIVDLLIDNAFIYYSGGDVSELEQIHQKLWSRPQFEDDEPIDLPDENPMNNIPEDVSPELEKSFPTPFDNIDSMSKNKSSKKVKKNLTKDK